MTTEKIKGFIAGFLIAAGFFIPSHFIILHKNLAEFEDRTQAAERAVDELRIDALLEARRLLQEYKAGLDAIREFNEKRQPE